MSFLVFPPFLKSYIESTNNDYDVIEFEYLYLPFKRHEVNTKSVLVARSVLLVHHFEKIQIPTFKTLRGFVGKILGPIGAVTLILNGEWPIRAFYLNVFNDLIWLGPFLMYLLYFKKHLK